LVVKHTFLEYRLPNPETSNVSEEGVSAFDDDHEFDLSSRRRSRAFSDSEIKYSNCVSFYSSRESCETESTCLETSSLSDAIRSSSSASSVDCESQDGAGYHPDSLDFACRSRCSSWDFAETIGEANRPGSEDAEDPEDLKVKSRVLEMNHDAAELMAMALKAEEEAQQLRLRAIAAQPSEDANNPIAVPVQMVQWMPVSYFTVGVPGNFSNESMHAAPACQAEVRKQKTGKAKARATQTTLMLRNIPNNYSRDMLIDLLDREGFTSCYDFVYLPVDFHRLAGLGYAFVNFAKIEYAEQAKQHFQGFDRWAVTSHKVCDVKWGEPLQGLAAHLDRYRNSPVMHEDVPEQYKPVYLQNGARQPFPVPTKRIRPPRIKGGGIPGMLPDFSAVSTVA